MLSSCVSGHYQFRRRHDYGEHSYDHLYCLIALDSQRNNCSHSFEGAEWLIIRCACSHYQFRRRHDCGSKTEGQWRGCGRLLFRFFLYFSCLLIFLIFFVFFLFLYYIRLFVFSFLLAGSSFAIVHAGSKPRELSWDPLTITIAIITIAITIAIITIAITIAIITIAITIAIITIAITIAITIEYNSSIETCNTITIAIITIASRPRNLVSSITRLQTGAQISLCK